MKVGRFDIEVSGPYPCWIRVNDDNGAGFSFSHRELRDLEYAVGWAVREARHKLANDGRSVCNENEL